MKIRVLSVAAVLVLAGGCVGDETGGPPQPAAEKATPSPATSVDTTDPDRARFAYGFTTAQQEFLKAIHKYPDAVGDSTDIELAEAARDFCGHDDGPTAYAGYGHPPKLDGIIENKKRIGVLERLAVRHLCPRYAVVLRRGLAGFTDGEHHVGDRIRPGTYRTTARKVSNCYWERTTPGGDIIANKHITYAQDGVTVTIEAGDGAFVSRGCGNWAPVR